jgi:hypothetical protein
MLPADALLPDIRALLSTGRDGNARRRTNRIPKKH